MTGLRTFDQRFYASPFGRFMSADRFKRAAKLNDSGSWNKYSYTRGDPVNRFDPNGTEDYCTDEDCCEDGEDCGCDPTVEDCDGGGGGGGGGGKPKKPKQPKKNSAIGVYENDAKKIAGMKNFKQPCNDDFAALGTNAAAVQAGASNVDIENGVGSSALQSSLWANTAGYAAAVAQFGNETIGQYIASHPGTVAEAQLNGNAIYINPALVSGNYYQNIAVTLHEILHNVTGLTDDAIQSALGLSTGGVSDNITQRLIKDCF